MKNIELYTADTAPEASRPAMNAAAKVFGFVPNMIAMLAGSPPALRSYMELTKQFSATSFSAAERELILVAASVANRCGYCVAAHSAGAHMAQVPPEVLEAFRTSRPVSDKRLEALRVFTTAVTTNRGAIDDTQLTAFLSAGFDETQVYEVLLGISLKTLSSYANHIFKPPIDEPLRPFAWSPTEG